jgi:hypothetical protein
VASGHSSGDCGDARRLTPLTRIVIDTATAVSTTSKQYSLNSAAASAESVVVLWLGELPEDAILFVRSRSGDVESARKLVEDQLEAGRGDTTHIWLDDGGAVNHAPDADTVVRLRAWVGFAWDGGPRKKRGLPRPVRGGNPSWRRHSSTSRGRSLDGQRSYKNQSTTTITGLLDGLVISGVRVQSE